MIVSRIALSLLIQAAAVASVTLTIAKGKIFQPVRNWLRDHWVWGAKLMTCGYCLSHWIAAAMVAAVGPVAVTQVPAVNYIVTAFALISMATLIAGGMAHLYMMQESQVTELQERVFAMEEAQRAKKMAKKSKTKAPEDEGATEDDGTKVELPPWTTSKLPDLFKKGDAA